MRQAGRILSFISLPLFNRLKHGEGGLFIFNFIHSVFSYSNPFVFFWENFISFIVLCTLYGFNDYTDRYNDLNNPKKEKDFAEQSVQFAKEFFAVNLSLTFITILLSGIFLGFEKLVVVAALYIVNTAYSKKLKATPVMDIVIVMLWGGLYVAIAGKFQTDLLIMAGVMTGIAHIFQTLTDKETDHQANIKTSAVAFSSRSKTIIAIYCLILSAAQTYSIGWIWGISAFVPLAAYAFTRRISLSWYLSRFYFSLSWIYVLFIKYGSP